MYLTEQLWKALRGSDADFAWLDAEIARQQAIITKLSNALAAILDFKEMETRQLVDAYGPGVTWGDVAANARAALREADK